MKVLDLGFVELKEVMGDDHTIVNTARKCFSKETKEWTDKDYKLLKYLWDNKHTSPFEFVEFTFSVKCPIPIARQWMRHRSWSYQEVSGRYSSEKIHLYEPEVFRGQSSDNKQCSTDGAVLTDFDSLYWDYLHAIHYSNSVYKKMIKLGVAREQARFVLPQAMFTEFYAKVDLHNLLHFLKLRLHPHAQKEMQEYAEAILELIRDKVPHTVRLFESDIKVVG
jgi:thymidylate synthase (FAD)